MPRPFVLLAVVAFTAVSVSPSSGGALVRDAPVSSGSEQLQFIFPDNIDCRGLRANGLQGLAFAHPLIG